MDRAKTERNERIIKMRESGKTFSQIAIEFGISIERARQICMREAQEAELIKEYGALAELSLRVRHSLGRAGITSLDYLIECLESKGGAAVRNIGEKGIAEIEQLVGYRIDANRKWREYTVLRRAYD